MKRGLAVGLLVAVLLALGLGYLTYKNSSSEDQTVYINPLTQELYVSSSERILYVPWQDSLKAFDSFFVSYTSINDTHTEVKLVINGSEKSATLGKRLEFTDTAGDKYVATLEAITCQYARIRINSL